jgi:small subunit ribosomal protein S20
MANHKSAQKSHLLSLRNQQRNRSILSRIKTYIKHFEDVAVTSGYSEESRKAFSKAESEIMKGVTKGILHKNTAARKVSRFAKKLKALEATAVQA